MGTAIGVGLTFAVSNWVENDKKAQVQRQTAMMAVYDIDEIAGCQKYGLFGFGFVMKDGSKQLFSNVGKKMREGITAAIEARKK